MFFFSEQEIRRRNTMLFNGSNANMSVNGVEQKRGADAIDDILSSSS